MKIDNSDLKFKGFNMGLSLLEKGTDYQTKPTFGVLGSYINKASIKKTTFYKNGI